MTRAAAPRSPAAAALAREFDRAFAAPPAAGEQPAERFLAVRVGGEPCAIRVSEILGLFAGRNIVALPTRLPELLGVAGFRGRIAPVYDLAALLGGKPGGTARWLAVPRSSELVALAFESFERQWLLAPQDVATGEGSEGGEGGGAHRRGVARIEGRARPILSLPSVLKDLSRRAAAARPTKEE